MSNRFDLEKALAAWRRTRTYNRAFDAEDLDELERHLRDQVTALVRRGAEEEAAYRQALREMGGYASVEREYRKVFWRKKSQQRQLGQALTWRWDMLTNYLKIAMRTLRKSPGFTFLNVAGLAVALACCLLIGLYVQDELGYDRHLADVDRMYRMTMTIETQGVVQPFAAAGAPLAAALLADQPQVSAAARLIPIGGNATTVRVGETRYDERRLFRTDPNVFDFFGLPLLRGEAATALAAPGQVVLTQPMAEKYFGAEDPIGRTLFINDREATVSGVMAAMPENTHFQADFLLPLLDWEGARFMESWHLNMFHTYVKLVADVDVQALEAEVEDFAYRYVGSEIEENGQVYAYQLQPVTDIHLRSDLRGELGVNGDATRVYTFAIIALFILLIAVVNFMNLTTARSLRRAKEVGVRKAVGGLRAQLAAQFLLESMLMSGLAMLGALVLAYLLLPLFNTLAGKAMAPALFALPAVWFSLLALASLTGLLAGSYPAFALSGFRPVEVLKGSFARNERGQGLRKALVVFQFTISIVLMVCTLAVRNQLDFLKNQQLGFDQAQVLVVPVRTDENLTYQTVKDELAQLAGVQAVSMSGHVPGRGVSNNLMRVEGEEARQVQMFIMEVDTDFLDTYEMTLLAGRGLSEDFPADAEGRAYLLNEAAVAALGWATPEAALGTQLDGYTDGTIVGVIADFHYRSLHSEVGPLMLLMRPAAFQYASLKLAPGTIEPTLAAVQQRVETLVPNQPFNYFFLDEDFDRQYAAEAQAGQLTTVFSLLAILIACLGLFGLAAYAAEQRTKEMGVRKVLGASTPGLVALLAKDFLKLIALAIVVAIPVAIVLLTQYLATYPYRIDLTPGLFLSAAFAALGIALLTVSYEAVKVAIANPVDNLRYE